MKQALNFSWKYLPFFDEKFLKEVLKDGEVINIPHTVKEVPYNYFDEKEYQKIVTYEKIFDVQEDIKNKTYILRFEAFMLKANIYLNGVHLGEYVSGYIPVEIDVSNYLKQKNNRLVVVLDSHEDKNYPPFGLVVDYLTFSGIYREVSLCSHPNTYLKDIFVFGDMDGNVHVRYDKIGEKEATIKHQLLTYPDNKVIGEFEVDNFRVDDVSLWDVDNPNLYFLKTSIESEDGKEEYSTRFGFRTSEFRKDGLYLNGKRIKICGLNRHQGYPIVGYAMPKSMQEDDANILKFEIGVNTVRTSHYPQSEHFLNRCDEIGLLVVNEIPGWQHIIKEEKWRKQVLINTKAMVINQRNHPSVICHGVRIDESLDDHELYEKTNGIAHEFDPYHQTIGVRNFRNSELLEDIYGYNDFTCNSLKKGLVHPSQVKSLGKPYLITEYMGHMNPVKPTSDEAQRIETTLHHLKVINDSLKYERVSGAIGWCFVDYHSHYDFGSGDRICAHGVMDLYRNPKRTLAAYASQQDKYPYLEVLHNMYAGDQAEAIFGDVYVLTNCDYVELYKNGQYVDKFYPTKNKAFKYIKHPPILIDDLVGATFQEEQFNKKSWKHIGKSFSQAAFRGYNHMTISNYLYIGFMAMKYRLQWNDMVDLFNKYVATWGGEAKTYTFKGYKNGQLVATCERGPATKYDLRISLSKDYLHEEETYDALRIRVQYIDEHGSILNYANRVVHIESKGPVKVLGEKDVSLLGGQLSFYVTSIGEKGTAFIKIKIDDIVKEIKIDVK